MVLPIPLLITAEKRSLYNTLDEEKLNTLLDTLYNNVTNNITTYQASTNSME